MNGHLELAQEWFKKADDVMEITLDDAQDAYEIANTVKSFVIEKIAE